MKNKHLFSFVMTSSIAMLLFPDLVMAGTSALTGGDSINSVLTKILNIMTGNIAKTLTIIAIAGSGYLAYIGQTPWMNMIKIAIGAGIIFGSANIGALLYGGL
tara:strand:- start:24460 stop:24768 length:309 start_codon:yes stop_codon:yes gene_type:complete